MNVQILTVIPLSKSLPKDHLTYFSSKDIAVGDIVEIPIKKKLYKALVTDIETAQNKKALLKDASFKLRAIKKNFGPSPFSPFFIETLHKLSRYYIGSKAQIFSEMIPEPLLHNLHKLKPDEREETKAEFTKERLLFQQPWNERISFYKTLIRESFAKGESVRFVVPTIQTAKMFEEELSKGIKEYCFVFHSKKTSKMLCDDWNTVVSTNHPVCLIHTPAFLAVPRKDCEVLVLEDENSPYYQGNKRPYVDGRIMTELFARTKNVKYIVADTLLRTETLERQKQGAFTIQGHLYFRIESSCEHAVVDMRNDENKKQIIDRGVMRHIHDYLRLGKKVILFALRPGLATTTVCNDCGTTQTYKGSPLTLHIHPETKERYFKSKKYNEIFRSNIVCSECGSWNLEALGIGTEKVEQLFEEYNIGSPIFRIDQNQNNTPKQIEETMRAFEETEGGAILVTSQIALPYLKQKVSLSCIVSLDSLFNIPQFNMYEKIMHIIMELSIQTEERMYVQTRYKDQKIISVIQSKKLLDFVEYDIEERKFWEYPPFANIIKMTYEGPNKEVAILERYIKKTFDGLPLYLYHTESRKKDYTETVIVLKTPGDAWPMPWTEAKDKETYANLKKKLDFLPPSWSIWINPQNFL